MTNAGYPRGAAPVSEVALANAANRAAVEGAGITAVAAMVGMTRIDTLLAVIELSDRRPELFLCSRPATAPPRLHQCDVCGIWFTDVTAHRGAHGGPALPHSARRPSPDGCAARSPGIVTQYTPSDKVARNRARRTEGALARSARAEELREKELRESAARAEEERIRSALADQERVARAREAQRLGLLARSAGESARWADRANNAARNGLGPGAIAAETGLSKIDVMIAILDAYEQRPDAFVVPAAHQPPELMEQCRLCGLWFGDAQTHAKAHRATGGEPIADPIEGQPESAPRTEFFLAVEREGLAVEYAALRDVVAAHQNLNELRDVLSTGHQRCSALAKKLSGKPGYIRDLGPLMLSVPGHLEDDGDRVQCHLCGLWQTSLAVHVSFHGIGSDEYRRRAGLTPETSLSSQRRFTARTPEQIEAEWAPRFVPIGCSTMTEAATWAAERGLGALGLARELGLTSSKVVEDFAAAGVAFIDISEQWRIRAELRSDPKDVLSTPQRELVDEAEEFVRRHGNLVHAGGRLRTTLARWRARAAAGENLAMFPFLDSADPGWRREPEERAACGEGEHRPRQFQAEGIWRDRFAHAGWDGWTDAVRWAAGEHGAFVEIAERLGTSELSVGEKIKAWWDEDPERLRVADDLQLAGHGDLYDDGVLVQCHVCGLWFKKVGIHCRVHGLTAEVYRLRFGLAADARLSSTLGMVRRPDQGLDDFLRDRAVERGLERPRDLVSWAVERGFGMAELAKELDVARGWLTSAFQATGLAFPIHADEMLVLARAEVASGGNLSDPADSNLRGWIRQWRSKRGRGLTSPYIDALDALDPDWILSARARTERLGIEFRAQPHRKQDAYWMNGLQRAGWGSTAEAVEWMVARGASMMAVAVMMGVPTSTVSARIRPLTPGYLVPGEASGTSIEAPLRALIGHVRSGGSVDDLPDSVRAWLDGRARESRDMWVNALLDELVPGWSSGGEGERLG